MTKNKKIAFLICILLAILLWPRDGDKVAIIPGTEPRALIIYESSSRELDFVGNSDHWRSYLDDRSVQYLRIDADLSLDRMDQTWQEGRENVALESLPWWAITTGGKTAHSIEFAQPDTLKELMSILKEHYDE